MLFQKMFRSPEMQFPALLLVNYQTRSKIKSLIVAEVSLRYCNEKEFVAI